MKMIPFHNDEVSIIQLDALIEKYTYEIELLQESIKDKRNTMEYFVYLKKKKLKECQ